MVRNYTPLKKKREDDKYSKSYGSIPDRAIIVYSNWLKKNFKESKIVLGGTEATLRRFVHYDYWHNKLKKPIIFDTKIDIIAYGSAEKQILEIASRIKEGEELKGIQGTCIISKEVPSEFTSIPSYDEVVNNKGKFIDQQKLMSNNKNLAQKIDNRYLLQYKMPLYTSSDLDEYYELPFTRKVPEYLRGFEFSVVTHRGCIGKCSFCSLTLTQGPKIISRSKESILREIEFITKLPFFKGNIDDLGGPSSNMYGMDCNLCKVDNCLNCKNLDRTGDKYADLIKAVQKVKGVKNVYVRSGIRYDLVSKKLLKILPSVTYDTLRIAPEHVNRNVLKLMNKDYGDLKKFISNWKKTSGKKLSFYFMTGHPGSSMKEAKELSKELKYLENSDSVQIFTPTPMTDSTAMYYAGMDMNKKKIHVPYTYLEKKEQKRVIFNEKEDRPKKKFNRKKGSKVSRMDRDKNKNKGQGKNSNYRKDGSLRKKKHRMG